MFTVSDMGQWITLKTEFI